MPAGFTGRHGGHRAAFAKGGHEPAIGRSASVGRQVELLALVSNLGCNLAELG